MKAKLLQDKQKTLSNQNQSSQNTSELESPPIKKLSQNLISDNTKKQLNNFINQNEFKIKQLPINTHSNQIINSNQSIDLSKQEQESFMRNTLYSKKALLNTKCNQAEIADREERKNINVFEIDPNQSYYDQSKKKFHLKIKPEYAIKAFKRSAADVKMDNPENLRPPNVLFKTVKYLCDNIVDIDNPQLQFKSNLTNKYFQYPDEPYSFKDICLFAEDRFRAIRQDFIILAPKASLECIQSHEIIARFLILSLNQCLDFKAFSGSQSLFKLLIQQLNATLTSLREFYSFNDRNISDKNSINLLNNNKAEFIAYGIMLSITDNFDLVSMLNLVTDDIKSSPLIKIAEQIVRKVLSRDFIGFFKILKTKKFFGEEHKNFDYLASCIMSLYLKDMRKSAFDVISAKVEKKVFNYTTNIKYFLDLLAFENFKEFFDFLNWYGIKFPVEIKEYLKYLKKVEANEDNKINDNFSESSSRKLSNFGSEGNNEIGNFNNGFSYFKNNDKGNNFCNLDDEVFEEIKDIFDNYDNKDYFIGEGKGAKSRFAYIEFYAETSIKDESDLFRVTNKRFIEMKREHMSRKEILIEKYIKFNKIRL